MQGRVSPEPGVPRTPFHRTLAVDGDDGFYQTANLFVRREVFEAVGGFRDWAFHASRPREASQGGRRVRASQRPVGEDTLFAWSARRLGARSVFAPDALVYHAVLPGDILDAIADRWHWAKLMPGLARLVPELREHTFYHRWFFDHWTAKFDLAAATLAVAALTRRSPWLLGTIPYIDCVRRQALAYRAGPGSPPIRIGRAAVQAAGQPAIDAATIAGLIAGSISWRSPVL